MTEEKWKDRKRVIPVNHHRVIEEEDENGKAQLIGHCEGLKMMKIEDAVYIYEGEQYVRRQTEILQDLNGVNGCAPASE